MKIKFYSYLNAFHVILMFIFSSYNKVYYFDISKTGKILLMLLRLEQIIKPFKFSFHQIKDNLGESYYPRIFGKNLIDVCDVIKEEILNKDSFGNIFGKKLNPKKVVLFFRKIFFNNIQDIIVFTNIIAWYRQLHEKEAGAIEFSIEKTPHFDILKEVIFKEHNIILNSHLSLRKIFKYFYLLTGNIYLLTGDCLVSIIITLKNFSGSTSQPEINTTPLISSLYTLRGFTFELSKRSDFPWLLMSDIPYRHILIYFEREDMPLTNDMITVLEQKGISHIAMSSGATKSKKTSVYQPTLKVLKISYDLTIRVFSHIYKEILSCRFNSIAYLPEAFHFIRKYSRAYDFYRTNNIKIDIDFIDFDPYRIARHLALDAAGGVSISHQLSNWPVPLVILGSCADVFFLFGPYYQQTLLKSGTCNDTSVISGYISDYSFAAAKESSKLLRGRLKSKGAKFIICYFDENSSDDRMSIIPHSRSAMIYEKFLNWVISDETIGLICSPKRPKTLLKRLPEIAELVKRAEDTGRCIFMDGEYAAANYPNEAAQASDIVVTLLIGGTASLESFLSGVRTVYLDLEGLYSYPEYTWGRNTIVFDNIDGLIASINRFRNNEKSFDELGNMNMVTNIKQKDPFMDGKASLRMGQYINWLLEIFNQGKTREEAIEYANEKYAGAWGKGNVIKWH